MEILENVAVKLTVPNAVVPVIQKHVEKFKVLEERETLSDVVIRWGLDEMTLLSDLLNFKKFPPSPIVRDYKWSGRFHPFDHQKTTAEFLSINERAFCFNEAGTGKTSSALWAADYLMTQGKVKKVLIICPLSIMYSAWRDDVFNTCMHRNAAVCYGASHKRKTIIESDYDFTIINYDGVNIVEDEIKKQEFDLIIVDECNAYKSHTTKRWKTLNRILNPETRIWMMTGTPASQSPMDAFGLG